MTPKWQKLASLAKEMCTLWFQFFGAVFASKGYPFKNMFDRPGISLRQWYHFYCLRIWGFKVTLCDVVRMLK